MSAVLGGLFIGVLSALPIVQLCNCCCLWIIGGGMLAAYLQQQNQPQPLTRMDGARVGFLAGVVGACVSTALDVALAPIQLQLVDRLMANAADIPPEVQDWLEAFRANPRSGAMVEFVLMLVFGSAIAAIGGIVGAAYFRKDVPPALGGAMTPPPLP